MLRVIGGKHGGRKLDQPNLKITRPTTDRAKEAIFSMIQFKVPNSLFLDLFSGSGSIAIEAASRGAMKVIAVENNQEAVKVIKQNLETLSISNVHVMRSNVMDYLATSRGKKFDFIFLDPPYGDIKLYNDSLSLMKEMDILKDEGWIIIETSDPKNISIPEGFIKLKDKKYGKSSILVLSNNI